MVRHRLAALAAAGALAAVVPFAASCSGGHPGGTRSALAARYLAIAADGNHHLDVDIDSLDGRDRSTLSRAQADLRDAAVTEHLFDKRLLAMSLPPAVEPTARQLVRANEARAALTSQAAASATLAELHGFEPRIAAANQPVERAVRAMRAELGLPPPESH